jgi:hypothetical protein
MSSWRLRLEEWTGLVGVHSDHAHQSHLATGRVIPASVLFVGLLGIDGPAAFLKPDAQDVDTRLHVLTVGSAATEDAEGSADGESAQDPASKPDLQEVLRKHGEGVLALRL